MKARIFLAAAALVAVVAVANAQDTKTTANPKGTGKMVLPMSIKIAMAFAIATRTEPRTVQSVAARAPDMVTDTVMVRGVVLVNIREKVTAPTL